MFVRWGRILMANDLLVIDIKASGLCDQSYPISIGVAGSDDQRWSWLVYPLETWHQWDREFESEHGITRDQLYEQGRDGFIICKEMNAVFSAQTLIAPTASTKNMLEKLFRDLSIRMAFDLFDMAYLKDQGMMDFSKLDDSKSVLTNVASADAAIVRDRLVSNGIMQI